MDLETGTADGTRPEMARVHRRVVRVGAVAAWTAAALLLGLGFATGDREMLRQAMGAVVVAGLMTAQIFFHRESGGVALVGSALAVMVTYAVTESPETLLLAGLALVVISSVGMLFVARNQLAVAVGIGLLLVATPSLWHLPNLADALQLGALMGVGFAMSAGIFLAVRNAAIAVDSQYQLLFERSPTAMLEEDWSKALAHVRSEYGGKPERIRRFLLAYPDVVRRAVGMAVIKRVNQAAVDLFEAVGAEELLSRRHQSMVTPDNVEAFADLLVALYQGRSEFEHEILAETLGHTPIWLYARWVDPSGGNNPTGLVVALADVGHVRSRERAADELVKAKDAFLASISHELRTPLTAVVGITSELSSTDIGDPEKIELMGLASAQAIEMSHIVEDLLVAARAEIGTVNVSLEATDIGHELSATVEGLGIDLDEVPDHLPQVLADPTRVRQILRNLLVNARRYGGENRRVLGGYGISRTWIEVRDDGEGIPPGEMERIFLPYETAHSGVGESVGLGLSVSRQLTELMGGSLFYRRDGDESVFRLELPLAETTVTV